MKYHKIKFLGRGTEGTVHEVEKDGKRYALKDISKKGEDINMLRKSNYLQKELDHPNIVKVFETYEDEENIVIIMELCGESLYELELEIKKIKRFVKQLIYAVKYLEEKNILHQDIKLGNILLCNGENKGENKEENNKEENETIKLTDFGLADIINREKGSEDRFSGYSINLAPEMCYEGYNYSINSWQIGIVLYQLLFNKLPFEMELIEIRERGNPRKCFEFMRNNKIKIPDVDEETFDILSRMLEIDPKKRITLDEMLQHSFFKDV